jgi:hypothetical protein
MTALAFFTIRQSFTLERIGDGFVTDTFQMLRHVSAGKVAVSACKKFNLLLLGNHARISSCAWLKRKS